MVRRKCDKFIHVRPKELTHGIIIKQRCLALIEESYSNSNRRWGVAKSQNAATGISHDAVGASDSKILSTVPLISTSQTRNERKQ